MNWSDLAVTIRIKLDQFKILVAIHVKKVVGDLLHELPERVNVVDLLGLSDTCCLFVPGRRHKLV